ncbi:MAG TPA: hypothetical protein VFV41_03455 [Streptosporangiaceae bacterium]|nr:hypothetical protein [Streptosporangiaceae bacterium]
MNSPDSKFSVLRGVKRVALRIAAIFRECHQAQLRMTMLRTAPDRYAPRPGKAPDTYAEFLFRTSGTLLHEPPAQARPAKSIRSRLPAAGQPRR